MSEGIKNLAGALLRAQQKIEGVSKDSTNPHYKSNYADLSAVIEAVIPALNAEGIVVIQAPVPAEIAGHLALATTLIHAETGESISGTAVVPLPKSDPQGYGSALTYTRRYALGSFVGLKFKDDDGNDASPRQAKQDFKRPARPEPVAEEGGPNGGGFLARKKALAEKQAGPATKADPTLAVAPAEKKKTSLFPNVKKGTGKPLDVKADRAPAATDTEEGGEGDGE